MEIALDIFQNPGSFSEFLTSVENSVGIGPWFAFKVGLTVALFLLFPVIRYLLFKFARYEISGNKRLYYATKAINFLLVAGLLLALFFIWVVPNLGTMGISFAAISAALTIALQRPIVNIVGWLALSVQRQFSIGDRIQVGNIAGDVIDIGLNQFTLVEIGNWVGGDQSTGRIVHIPNGQIFTEAIQNYTQGFRFIWHEIPILITFESNWRRAKEMMEGIASERCRVDEEEASEQLRNASHRYNVVYRHLTPVVWLEVAQSGIMLTLRFICDPRRRRSLNHIIWQDILDALATCDDIALAYNTTRLYVTPGQPVQPVGPAGKFSDPSELAPHLQKQPPSASRPPREPEPEAHDPQSIIEE